MDHRAEKPEDGELKELEEFLSPPAIGHKIEIDGQLYSCTDLVWDREDHSLMVMYKKEYAHHQTGGSMPPFKPDISLVHPSQRNFNPAGPDRMA